MLARSSSLLLLILLGLNACVSTEEYMRLKGEKDALARQHEDMARYQRELQDRMAGLERHTSTLEAVASDADAVKSLQRQLQDTLDKLRSGGPSLALGPLEGVSIVERPDGVGFQVEGAVLFDSGQALLKESAHDTLRKLIPELIRTGKNVRVDGHTDADPIARSRWRSNVHLSAERAAVVGDFLVANNFPAERLSVAGFGEHRPIETGQTDVAKRKNRRVEILVMR